MVEEVLTQADLDNCTGTETYHRISMLAKFNSTDGVKVLADKGKAYWLIDAIASYQMYPVVRNMEFQFWTLITKNRKGILTLTDGDGKVIKKQEIPYTDFPLSRVQLYLTNNVLLLPGEY